ncbi:MAG: 3'-5' exonuclease [Bacteroidota bacterium]
MNYIIVDLEATCWKKKEKGQTNEIIEIGAVSINEQGEVLGEFAEFIKPKLNPILSDFCLELTSISQAAIDTAQTFPEVIKDFQDWIGVNQREYFLCSWGFYDKRQFSKDCQLHEIDTNWLEAHISVKHQYAKIKALSKPCGMARALNLEELVLEGTHHRGIDDARNISRIFRKYLSDWDFSMK